MIAYTYNEPTVYYEYTFDTARLAVEHGIRNLYVTNGFQTLAAIDSIAPYLHAMNVDLKGYTEQFYRATCGGRLEPVLRNIEYVAQKTDIWIEVTTLVVPGMNDSDAELRDIAQFLASVSCDIPWHISAFHPDYHIRDRPATPRERLERAYAIGIESGLRYVYVGNLMDPKRTNTYCPQCGEALIHRMWYEARPVWPEPPNGDIVDGKETGLPGECPECGTVIAGVWR
jgi:pyruvate formate lyase activating enzyme